MDELLIQRAKAEFSVMVDEEQGRASYVWFPPVCKDEFESWWIALPTLKGPTSGIGGEWVKVDGHSPAFTLLWHSLEHYCAEICCDQDSNLQTPDGRVLIHAGFNWSESKDTDFDPKWVAVRIQAMRERWKKDPSTFLAEFCKP